MTWINWYILVSWFAGLCGIVGVLRQPAAAFRRAGRSKVSWLIIQIIGFASCFFGIFFWAAWHFRALPSVRRHGGRQPRPRSQPSAAARGAAEPAPTLASLPRPSQIPSLVAMPGAVLDEPGFYLTPQGYRYWTGLAWQ
jgi:hypothetical protein